MMLAFKNYDVNFQKQVALSSKVNAALVEFVNGLEVIKIFNQDAQSYRRFKDAAEKNAGFSIAWMNERAILYRKMKGIPQEWGTAVTVQAMVFGNMGETSATGVCFSRDAGNGENAFNGEYLVNAQGEDVVAGIRTPQQITLKGSLKWAEQQGVDESIRRTKFPSMEEAMPEIYAQLNAIQKKLEKHYHDMQDMEFTVQDGQ